MKTIINDGEDVTFSVKINDGPVQAITVKTGKYYLAVCAALALLPYEEDEDAEEVKIEIWTDSLLPQYGPYIYWWDYHHVHMMLCHMSN